MGLFGKLTRAQYGQIHGTTAPIKGTLSVTVEKNNVVCYALGAKDVVLSKDNIKSVELTASNVKRSGIGRQGIAAVNVYTIIMNDGAAYSLDVYVGDVYRILPLIQKN